MTEPAQPRDAGTGWAAPDQPAATVARGPGQVERPGSGREPGMAAAPGLRIPPPPPRRIVLPPGIRPPNLPSTVTAPGTVNWPGPATARVPSGLFPSGPPRPTYREPHPARLGAVVLGGGAGTLWMALFGLLAGSARGYVWWTISAGLAAWASALALARWGLRGIAAGVALTSGLGVSIAAVVVIARWAAGHWLLW